MVVSWKEETTSVATCHYLNPNMPEYLCWYCTFLQIRDYVETFHFNFCRDNAALQVRLGLSTKNTWLMLGIDHVLL